MHSHAIMNSEGKLGRSRRGRGRGEKERLETSRDGDAQQTVEQVWCSEEKSGLICIGSHMYADPTKENEWKHWERVKSRTRRGPTVWKYTSLENVL